MTAPRAHSFATPPSGGNFFGAKPVHAAVKPKQSDLGGVVSLFAEEESEYHRYAAAVAATEPLRELRDARAKQALGNVKVRRVVTAAGRHGRRHRIRRRAAATAAAI